jgi:hypothetical protein
MAAAIYRQQKVLSHFPVCCWIDWLLMIKNCLIESGPPCIYISFESCEARFEHPVLFIPNFSKRELISVTEILLLGSIICLRENFRNTNVGYQRFGRATLYQKLNAPFHLQYRSRSAHEITVFGSAIDRNFV